MALITDPDLLDDSAADDGSQEVYINTATKTIKLVIVGNLSTDGVTLKALYSFLKEEWRLDPNTKNLAAFPFPMVPITDESFEFVDGWDFFNDTGRYLIRNAGWTVKNTAGLVTQMWAGIIGLGAIESNDQLYFQQVTAGAATNFQLTGQVNQAIQILSDPNGDGNFADGYDRRSFLSLFAREYAQLYGKSTLTDIGVTQMAAQAYRFPISTGTDLKITDTDAYVSLAGAITSASWAASVATINTTAAHGLASGDYVEITGVTPVGYNKRGVATVIDTDTFTIPITADPGAYTSGGSVGSVFSLVKIRYFDQAYTKDVDSTTDRNFGIVVDVGTHSGVDGSTTASGNVLTTAEGAIPTSNNPLAGGTLIVHEGANAGTYTISGNPTATTVTITTTFANTLSNQSFTIYPPVATPMTAEEIYTAVQYRLRQNSDIDATDQSVTGKTADQLMYFVGDTLTCGRAASGAQPANPNGGGSGVIIEGFASNDTNRLTFYDNTNTARTFPFVATLTLNFGANLIADASAKYWVYFTTLPGASNDFGESGALIVDDNAAADMAGNISGQSSITKSFNYDGNVQGGRTAGTDAAITVVGLGLSTGQYVRATGTIARSTANTVSLVAALERNYANP